MSYSLTGVEREVVLSFNAAEDTADIYTADPVYIRKMDKLVELNPAQFKVIKQDTLDGKVIAMRYEFPKRFITIRSKDKTMSMTDEQKAESAERLRLSRQINSMAQE